MRGSKEIKDEVKDLIKVGDTVMIEFFEKKVKVTRVVEGCHNTYWDESDYTHSYDEIIAVYRKRKLIWHRKGYKTPFIGGVKFNEEVKENE